MAIHTLTSTIMPTPTASIVPLAKHASAFGPSDTHTLTPSLIPGWRVSSSRARNSSGEMCTTSLGAAAGTIDTRRTEPRRPSPWLTDPRRPPPSAAGAKAAPPGVPSTPAASTEARRAPSAPGSGLGSGAASPGAAAAVAAGAAGAAAGAAGVVPVTVDPHKLSHVQAGVLAADPRRDMRRCCKDMRRSPAPPTNEPRRTPSSTPDGAMTRLTRLFIILFTAIAFWMACCTLSLFS